MILNAGEASAAVGLLLAVLRLLPTAILSPFLGGPLVPPPIRLGLALALGWAASRGAPPPPAELLEWAPLLAAAARELALGTALGLGAALPVEAARAGGRLADTLRGATLSELHVAPIRQRESATGDLLAQWCVVVAAWGGGDRLLLQGLLGSFAPLPPGAPLPSPLLGLAALRLLQELLGGAISLAAPAAAGVLGADLAMALVERVAPGTGATGVAQPARAALGLALLALASSAIGGRLTGLVAFAGRSASLVLAPGSP